MNTYLDFHVSYNLKLMSTISICLEIEGHRPSVPANVTGNRSFNKGKTFYSIRFNNLIKSLGAGGITIGHAHIGYPITRHLHIPRGIFGGDNFN